MLAEASGEGRCMFETGSSDHPADDLRGTRHSTAKMTPVVKSGIGYVCLCSSNTGSNTHGSEQRSQHTQICRSNGTRHERADRPSDLRTPLSVRAWDCLVHADRMSVRMGSGRSRNSLKAADRMRLTRIHPPELAICDNALHGVSPCRTLTSDPATTAVQSRACGETTQ